MTKKYYRMLVRHFKNHSPTPPKYVRLKLPTFATVAANNSFHLKLLANVRNCWQCLRKWNASQAQTSSKVQKMAASIAHRCTTHKKMASPIDEVLPCGERAWRKNQLCMVINTYMYMYIVTWLMSFQCECPGLISASSTRSSCPIITGQWNQLILMRTWRNELGFVLAKVHTAVWFCAWMLMTYGWTPGGKGGFWSGVHFLCIVNIRGQFHLVCQQKMVISK